MAEIFHPDDFLKQIFPKSFDDVDLVNRGFNLKRIAKRYLQKAFLLAGDDLEISINKVLDAYAMKALDLKAERTPGFFKEATNKDKLLRQRIKGVTVQAQIGILKDKHEGQYYQWLPSGAENPDPQHQLLYGKIFKVGDGDQDGNMPGERYGCQCGIKFLSDSEKKEFDK